MMTDSASLSSEQLSWKFERDDAELARARNAQEPSHLGLGPLEIGCILESPIGQR